MRAARTAAVERVRRAVAGLDEVTLPPAVAKRGELALQRTGTALLPLRSEQSPDRQIDSATTLREELDPGSASAGVTTYLAGQPTIWAGMQELSKEDLAKAEAGGFPIVAVILLVVFGSLAAAVLPLALGFVSVIVTGALIYFISLGMTTSVFVTNMASMIGIGVAIDYSLFILARYREERARRPRPGRGAGGGPLHLRPGRGLLRPCRDRLAGRALDGRQPGAALDGAGRDDRRRRLDPHRDHPAAGADRDARRPRDAGRHRRQGAGRSSAAAASARTARLSGCRWTTRVMAHPWLAVIGVSAVLLTLAIPLLSIETGTQALSQFPKDSDVRVGNELASKQLGGGTDPVQIVASFGGSRAQPWRSRRSREVRAHDRLDARRQPLSRHPPSSATAS